MIRNQSWLLVMSLTLVERIRGPKKKKEIRKKERKKIHLFSDLHVKQKKHQRTG